MYFYVFFYMGKFCPGKAGSRWHNKGIPIFRDKNFYIFLQDIIYEEFITLLVFRQNGTEFHPDQLGPFNHHLNQFLIRIKFINITIYFQNNVHINNINMIYYDRIEFFEEIDVSKTNQISKKSVTFVTIGIFQVSSFKDMFAIVIMIY